MKRLIGIILVILLIPTPVAEAKTSTHHSIYKHTSVYKKTAHHSYSNKGWKKQHK
jgi:hypothetical protein